MTEIDINSLTFPSEYFHRSDSSHLYYVKDSSNQQTYVLKVILDSPQFSQYVHRELEAIRRIGEHPYIVRYLYTDRVPDSKNLIYWRILMEYCVGGDLYNEVVSKKVKVDIHVIVKWLWELLTALAHVHELNIVHRDIKPDNILLTSSDLSSASVKLCDFGISKYLEELRQGADQRPTPTIGTALYWAPEMFTGRYDKKVDVWAIGIVAHELATGRNPFQAKDDQGMKLLREGVRTRPYEFRPTDTIHPLIADLIRLCFTYDSSRRPSIPDLLRQPLFQIPLSSEVITPAVRPPTTPRVVTPAEIRQLHANSIAIVDMKLREIEDFGRLFGDDASARLANIFKLDVGGILQELNMMEQSDEVETWKGKLEETKRKLQEFIKRDR